MTMKVEKVLKPQAITSMPDEAVADVAAYFRVLAEPSRLKLLQALCDGRRSVGDLTELLDCSMANVSRHLSALARQGMVERETEGTTAYYSIADPTIYALCDLVCKGLLERMEVQNTQRKALKKHLV